MRSARAPVLQFSFGRGGTEQQLREQRALLPQQQPQTPSALSRLNLRPATVAFDKRGRGPGYACLSIGQQSGAYSGEESGDDDEGAVLPERSCRRCCLFLCVLALMVAGTGLVLRFLLARDSHPSSPAAKLAAAKLGVASSRRPTTTTTSKPPTVRAVATPARPTTPRVVAVPVLHRSPPPPSPPPQRVVRGNELPKLNASFHYPPPFSNPSPPSPPMIGLSDAPPHLPSSSPPPPPPPSPGWPSPVASQARAKQRGGLKNKTRVL